MFIYLVWKEEYMEKVIYDYEYVFKDNGNKDGVIIYCYGYNLKFKIFEMF